MKHYVCTGGCEGVSDKPGTCQAIACPKNAQPLTTCECGDGRHEKEMSAAKEPESQEKENE